MSELYEPPAIPDARAVDKARRPNMAAPLAVWEYAFALEGRCEVLWDRWRQAKKERHEAIQENEFMKNERRRLKSRIKALEAAGASTERTPPE